MDTFVEQIIIKKKTALDYLIVIAVSLVTLALVFFIITKFNIIFPLCVLIVWGAWWLITGRNMEFEYSITNGEMDIDCIIARRRRKRLTSVTCSKVEAYGPLKPEKLVGRKFDRTIMAAPSMEAKGNYYFTYRSKKYGNTMVVFCPDERVQTAFYNALPRLKQLELDRELKNQ